MLQKLEPHISECLERASNCRNRAAQAEDDALTTELLDLERNWTHLARGYEFVESLERFVLSARAEQDRRGPR